MEDALPLPCARHDRNRSHSGSHAVSGLNAAGEVLSRGSVLCVFPEGSRSKDGHLHRGHTGAAQLALEHDCPIVPVGITGTRDAQPQGKRIPRPGHPCAISIGTAIIGTAGGDLHHQARVLTGRLMVSIRELSGQSYLQTYTDHHASTPTPAQPAKSSDGVPHTPTFTPPAPLLPAA